MVRCVSARIAVFNFMMILAFAVAAAWIVMKSVARVPAVGLVKEVNRDEAAENESAKHASDKLAH